jgi:signal transduction histidine kinase
MDQKGDLLFHLEHPEVKSARMNVRDPACNRCHPSFDFAETILEKREGILQYRIGNGPEEMAGFAPVKFGNESWIVVVCSQFDSMAAVNEDLRDHLMFLGIVVLALGGASFLLVRDSRLKMRVKEEARFWKERQSLESRAQEMERKKISQHLHDELGQHLTALKFRIGFMEKALRDSPGMLLDDCKSALQDADQVIEDVRRISQELSPVILENLGLQESLRWLADGFRRHYHVRTTLSLGEVNDLFATETQIIIYRMFQEILTNVGKHAEAGHVIIWAGKEGSLFTFTVEDDGKGFEVEKAVLERSGQKGLGLFTMMERARALGGALEIESERGKGTRVTFTLPIQQEEANEGSLSGGAGR